MNFWWVNHKQTVKLELGGYYIWSPKHNRDGSRNHSYENMLRVKRSDVIFSYAYGLIKAIGIVTRPAYESTRPLEFGTFGEHWDNSGWLVPVDWEILDWQFKPKNYIDRIAPLLPEKYSPIRLDGNGNQGIYLAEISPKLGKLLLDLSRIQDEILEKSYKIYQEQEEFEITLDTLTQSIPETEKDQLIKSRIGQGLFRNRVEEIEHHCRITRVSDKRFLIASHIKPWRDSNNRERLDGNNGLLLSPHIDKLFDGFWISFTNTGQVLVANNSIKDILISWGIDPAINVGSFTNDQQNYLEYHRTLLLKNHE